MRYLNIVPGTIVDGPGIRTSIYLSGCTHKCQGCHNANSWDFSRGTYLTKPIVDNVIESLLKNPLSGGVTISGGDPFCQEPSELTALVKQFYDKGINVLVYSGYTFEELRSHEALQYIDTLIDGKFMFEFKDFNLMYRGSSNQRIINVPESLKTNSIILRRFD